MGGIECVLEFVGELFEKGVFGRIYDMFEEVG